MLNKFISLEKLDSFLLMIPMIFGNISKKDIIKLLYEIEKIQIENGSLPIFGLNGTNFDKIPTRDKTNSRIIKDFYVGCFSAANMRLIIDLYHQYDQYRFNIPEPWKNHNDLLEDLLMCDEDIADCYLNIEENNSIIDNWKHFMTKEEFNSIYLENNYNE